MAPQGLGSGLLVLIELGASWPTSLVETDRHAALRVLVELEGEGPRSFAARVAACAAALFPRNLPIGRVVIACNARVDETALSARREIAKTLFTRRRTKNGGTQARAESAHELVLAGPSTASERCQRAFEALARELAEARSFGAEISLSFGRESRLSDAGALRVA